MTNQPEDMWLHFLERATRVVGWSTWAEERFARLDEAARRSAQHLHYFHVDAAGSSDTIGVSAYSAEHAVRIVRTYLFPFAEHPLHVEVRAATTGVPPGRHIFHPDIWSPALPREPAAPDADYPGRLLLPWLHPSNDHARTVLDMLIDDGFMLIDIPHITDQFTEALFGDPRFIDESPTECARIAFVISTPDDDVSKLMPTFAQRLPGPLDVSWFTDDAGTLEPRLVLTDMALPRRYRRHRCPLRFNIW